MAQVLLNLDILQKLCFFCVKVVCFRFIVQTEQVRQNIVLLWGGGDDGVTSLCLVVLFHVVFGGGVFLLGLE